MPMNTGNDIYIYCREVTPRLEYVAGFLSDSLRVDFIVTGNPVPAKYTICYGVPASGNSLVVPDSGFCMKKESGPVIRN